jgi:hypothetical protein
MLRLDPSAHVQQRSPIPAIKDLWFAVLAQAVADLNHPLFRQGVIRWIEDEGMDPGCFNWICAALDFDAGYLRHRLLKASKV